MHKRLCFIYTETTGLHKTNNNVIKKELFKYARMVTMNYIIGYYKDMKDFVCEKKVRTIVQPRCMFIPKETEIFHNITQEIAIKEGIDPDIIIKTFKKDIEKVDIIVSHNVDFHLKTILSEAVRYNINLDLSKYIVIDTINFTPNTMQAQEYVKLKDLAIRLKIKNEDYSNLELIREVFTKLYKKFEKSCRVVETEV
jgi:DNA polymerase III epsilon subunit-like protein